MILKTLSLATLLRPSIFWKVGGGKQENGDTHRDSKEGGVFETMPKSGASKSDKSKFEFIITDYASTLSYPSVQFLHLYNQHNNLRQFAYSNVFAFVSPQLPAPLAPTRNFLWHDGENGFTRDLLSFHGPLHLLSNRAATLCGCSPSGGKACKCKPSS